MSPETNLGRFVQLRRGYWEGVESRVAETETVRSTRGRRYSRVPLDFVLQYRAVLARRTDGDGATGWTARIVGMPRLEASGTTRMEALRRVREMAAGKGTASLGV
jgi:hypothetical protein